MEQLKEAYEAYKARLEVVQEQLFKEMVLPVVLSRAKQLKITGLAQLNGSFYADNCEAFYFGGHMANSRGTEKQIDFLEYLSVEMEAESRLIHQ